MTRLFKFLALSLFLAIPALSQERLTPDEIPGHIAACAASAGIKIGANFEGTLDSIFGNGKKVNGKLAVEATSSLQGFLEIFPEDQRLTAYEVYVKCLQGYQISDPEQQGLIDSILFQCEIASAADGVIDTSGADPAIAVEIASFFKISNMENFSGLQNLFGTIYVGEGGSVIRKSNAGRFSAVREANIDYQLAASSAIGQSTIASDVAYVLDFQSNLLPYSSPAIEQVHAEAGIFIDSTALLVAAVNIRATDRAQMSHVFRVYSIIANCTRF